MAEQLQMNAIGVAEMQHAALGEARRLMREAKGDRRVAARLVYDLLVERGWLAAGERDVLVKMLEVGTAGNGAADAQYREVRRMHDGLIVSGGASPVALALAAGVVGSYEVVEAKDGTVSVMAASKRNYQAVLGAAGAVIGGAFGGGLGAAAGGAIGGVIGYIVDDCKD
ncbi:hypothetical protein JTF08_16435 [Micrococcaceae bacterium RIT802]|nr:hypothetical protein [Micrococcaceae bacterium RIT 802]